ncbi:hypothetical protein [Pseudomonas purpurea]|uniref:hypothetical protein n=1 Tax=Pseudomonas purpurea TaxID=3136737 RepID=UPI003262DAC1
MLVNAQKSSIVQQIQRPDMDPAMSAASALYSGQMQNVQNAANIQGTAATQHASTTVADNVDAAFAKTRVLLQTTDPVSSTPQTTTATDSAAMTEFKEYMSKSPEQRMRDSILKELGITEEDLANMSPEKQLAIGKEIAQRIEDKMKMAEAEKAQTPASALAAEKTLAAI